MQNRIHWRSPEVCTSRNRIGINRIREFLSWLSYEQNLLTNGIVVKLSSALYLQWNINPRRLKVIVYMQIRFGVSIKRIYRKTSCTLFLLCWKQSVSNINVLYVRIYLITRKEFHYGSLINLDLIIITAEQSQVVNWRSRRRTNQNKNITDRDAR
jgi:hypothetical protein